MHRKLISVHVIVTVGYLYQICALVKGNIFEFRDKVHSEKKGYQNGAPGVLLLQMVPFFQRGTLFSLIIMYPWVTGAPK